MSSCFPYSSSHAALPRCSQALMALVAAEAQHVNASKASAVGIKASKGKIALVTKLDKHGGKAVVINT